MQILLNVTILQTFQIEVDDVVKMQLGSDPIPFHVGVRWTGDQPIGKLEYDTVIEGAKKHQVKVLFPCTHFPGKLYPHLCSSVL